MTKTKLTLNQLIKTKTLKPASLVKHFFLKVCLCFLFFNLISIHQSQAQCHIDDWTALKVVYDNSNANNLDWLNGTWFTIFANTETPKPGCNLNNLVGVSTNESGRVNQLNTTSPAPFPQIFPPLPPPIPFSVMLSSEIGLLQDLEVLLIQRLMGNLPETIGNLTKLKRLSLTVPDGSPISINSIENLTQLTYLNLSGTRINGNFPAFISNFSNLKELNLVLCDLTGSIPASIGNLTQLTKLYLNNNQLSGSIPETIGNLSELTDLFLNDNPNLNGVIPASLGNLSKLEALLLNNNSLTGNLPAEIGNLTQLMIINVSNNPLSGCFEPNLANLCGKINLWDSAGQFDADWVDFCASASGVCNNGETNIFGCRDPKACNYDVEAAYTNNSICEFPMINCDCSNTNGCMDPNAMNFNPNADCNDGTCEYDNTMPPGAYNFNPSGWNVTLENTCNTLSFEVIENTTGREISFSEDGRLSVDLNNISNGLIKIRTQGINNCQAEWTFNLSPNNCVDNYSLYQPWLNRMTAQNNCNNFEVDAYRFKTNSDVLYPPDKIYVQYENSGTLYDTFGNFLCSDFVNDTITDCLSNLEIASNNFWSCPTSGGCTDPSANNYNPNAACNNGTCNYDDGNQNGGSDNNIEIFASYPWLTTFANPSSCNGESIIVYDAGSYNFILIQNGNEGKLYFENGTFYCNETPAYSCVAAYNLNNVAQTWTCENTPIISGCTDATAINYNSNATEDDGSCQYKNSNTTNCNLNDWAALKALYENTAGDNWSNNTGWAEVKDNEPSVACNLELMFGVETDASGRVTEVNLIQNQLNGTIPAVLSELSNLKVLNLTGNLLRGSIPEELGNLNNLYSLDLSVNELSGSIPVSLGNLSNLTKLTLFINQLNGTIPTELSNLSNLTSLNLHANLLSGSIPTELSNLVNLTELMLNFNQLSGSIPPELGNLNNLIFLGLAGNQLSGNIPPELGNLSNLEILSLSGNQLSGNIPFQFGNLSNLQGLVLTDNQLGGSIPAEFGNLSNLENLYIANNQLSGSIPAEFGNLSSLEILNLSNNQLNGGIPTEFGNLSSLTILSIRDNDLNGCYPQSIRSLCTQFTGRFFDGNRDISGGNNFDALWDDFCATDNGVCSENSSNNSEIFTIYPWLSTFVNESNCISESITVYDAGNYNFILIQSGNESKLYYQNGTFYCNQTPTYSCVDAYGLTNVAQTWTCGNSNTPISGCTDTNAINYNASATVEDGSCEYTTPDCRKYTGTFFYQDCGGINYYFIRLEDGRVFDPYFDDGIGITPIEGQQIRFDYEVKTDVSTPCAISESPITITCFEDASVRGCTDVNATNYNSSATVNDSSCQYENSETCNTNIGTFFYEYCGRSYYYFIRLDDGRVFDPYIADNPDFFPREGQQIRFDYVIKTDVTTPCGISESPITITCFETIESTVFNEFLWLNSLVDINNCNDASVSMYNGGGYYFIYVQSTAGNSLYYQDGTFYCMDAPGYSCRSLYSLTNAELVWNCEEGNSFKHNQNDTASNALVDLEFKIYPNPATNKVFIDLPNQFNYQIKLMDISGKVIKQTKTELQATTVELNVSDLPKGMYLVELRNEKRRNIQKLIVE